MNKLIYKWLVFVLPILFVESGLAQKVFIGYPNKSYSVDPRSEFKNPPQGYGEVPFFWWQGDTLTRERLTWELDELAKKKITALQINYSHTDKGGVQWGLTLPSKPALFTEEWWNLFSWFMKESNKRGMTVALSDYTLGVGQGFAIDAAKAEVPELEAWILAFKNKQINAGSNEIKIEDNLISVVAFPVNDHGEIKEGKSINLTFKVKNGVLKWKTPKGSWNVITVYKKKKQNSYDPTHPLSGKTYIKKFYEPFVEHCPEQYKNGLNFFFSDELDFHINGFVWSDYFKSEFLKRKGYDITPYLAGLFEDIGNITPKIKLDYNDVMVSLSEENYFKPVYDWHHNKGMMYGCDHGGRGYQVDEFGDYFRTQKWNVAPGCDQPSLKHDIIKNKIASSIAHMNDRPRTWLEGFYGSGWDTSTEKLVDAIFANFVMGQNLLSLHGLYYSTPGGWWEWAPPCNHFRMPYWKEMDHVLNCVERLSYILSQGYHCADIAVMYPVEPVVAGYGNDSKDIAFELAQKLYNNSIDFDFMDGESLIRSTIKDGKLNISKEHYSILILPAMKAMRYAALKKALDFKKAGGIVICLGNEPEATDANGRNDKHVNSIVKQLFGTSSNQVFKQSQNVINYIQDIGMIDFCVPSNSNNETNPAYVQHRQIGNKQYYAVYNVKKGTECYFRATGSVDLWDPWTGNTKPLGIKRTTDNGTIIDSPLTEKDIQIFVFDPSSKPIYDLTTKNNSEEKVALDDKWEFTIIPSLDNKWGDYEWPGEDKLMEPQIRFISYRRDTTDSWKKEQNSYETYFKVLPGLPIPLSDNELIAKANVMSDWEDLTYSLRWGVKNDYGHQGYHGLKMEMYDDFIRLGEMYETPTGIERKPYQSGNYSYLLTNVVAPYKGTYHIKFGSTKPEMIMINGVRLTETDSVKLNKGANQVLMQYFGAVKSYLVFVDESKTGKRVLEAEKEKPLAMKWNGDLSILPYDVAGKDKLTEQYQFLAAPGLKKLKIRTFGTIQNISGGIANQKCLSTREDGLNTYEITFQQSLKESTNICLTISNIPVGHADAAAIPYPINQTCETGLIKIGNWADCEGLACYSGGAKYEKTIYMDSSDLNKKIILDLGKVVSTAHLYINGKDVGVRVKYPWTFDLSNYLKAGDNKLEIIVYNTASNQYSSIPTRYRGSNYSGILGPVNLIKTY